MCALDVPSHFTTPGINSSLLTAGQLLRIALPEHYPELRLRRRSRSCVAVVTGTLATYTSRVAIQHPNMNATVRIRRRFALCREGSSRRRSCSALDVSFLSCDDIARSVFHDIPSTQRTCLSRRNRRRGVRCRAIVCQQGIGFLVNYFLFGS